MKESIIENIIENLLFVMPVLHKRLLKANPAAINTNIKLSRLHIMIMGKLKDEGKLHASEIGRDFFILKPQMTRLIKELVTAGMIEKKPDVKDRRAYYLVLTNHGKSTLEEFSRIRKKSLSMQLSGFNDDELKEFASILNRLRQMGHKMEK